MVTQLLALALVALHAAPTAGDNASYVVRHADAECRARDKVLALRGATNLTIDECAMACADPPAAPVPKPAASGGVSSGGAAGLFFLGFFISPLLIGGGLWLRRAKRESKWPFNQGGTVTAATAPMASTPYAPPLVGNPYVQQTS